MCASPTPEEVRLKEIESSNLKAKLAAATTIAVSGVAAIAIAFINNQTKLHEIAIAADKQNNDHLSQFVSAALNSNPERRARFAHYFATLSATEDARERWRAYHDAVAGPERQAASAYSADSILRIRNWLRADQLNLQRLMQWSNEYTPEIGLTFLRFGDEYEVQRAAAIQDLDIP